MKTLSDVSRKAHSNVLSLAREASVALQRQDVRISGSSRSSRGFA